VLAVERQPDPALVALVLPGELQQITRKPVAMPAKAGGEL